MRRRSGFTLVELIAVLFLLTILLAILLPALIGYLRRAKEQSVLIRARAALLAAQTLLTEGYGTERWTGETEPIPLLRRGNRRPPTPFSAEELLELAELSQENVESIWIGWDEHAAVTQFVWSENGGAYTAVWNGKNWSFRCGETPE